jgi:hypothetical protein
VIVSESPTSEPIELPTSAEDNTLGLNTLSHAFPGAHGLKYKAPSGASRALMIDNTGTKFFPPAGGWADKLFTVIFPSESTKRGSGKFRDCWWLLEVLFDDV